MLDYLSMILRMSFVTALYVLITYFVWLRAGNKKLGVLGRISVGVIFGICSILSTHFGIIYDNMVLNVRDIGPLAAGLFFDPVSGVIAGLIGGIERYIAGAYFGVSTYTKVACSVSTCLAGFLAMALNIKVFGGKKPAPFYAFFMGAAMEVFHMYAVFVTHQDDIYGAFQVVRVCAIPMIFFTGLGLAVSSVILQLKEGQWMSPFSKVDPSKKPIALTFQKWLFIVTFAVAIANFLFNFLLQSQSAYQEAVHTLEVSSSDILDSIKEVGMAGKTDIIYTRNIAAVRVGRRGEFDFIDDTGSVISGSRRGEKLPEDEIAVITEMGEDHGYFASFFGENYLIRTDVIREGLYFVTAIPNNEVFYSRNVWAYETGLSEVLLFTVVFLLISLLLYYIVEKSMVKVNDSLDLITDGNLNEVVNVRASSEFAALSDDINQTVDALKGYIEAAEKKMEEELMFAYTIQDSALPKNFVFPGHDEFELFATMDPAKEVGGDFYDFFFVSGDRLALVIADVSGKGIPAALFMMRSKTAVRSLAESGKSPGEIMYLANNALCEGNDAGMFVTVWMGILDLYTGKMTCANAGHEYPVIMHENGEWEYLRDKHSVALGTIEGLPAREYEMDILPGDRIFVYTDGVPEAINTSEEQYGENRLLEVLNANKDLTMKKLLPVVRNHVSEFVGEADQFDDITMLGFHLNHYYSTNPPEVKS